MEESTLTSLHIFPNPTRDVLNITGITGNGGITLTLQTYTGKILQQKVLLADGRLDLSSLPAGIYMLKMEDGMGVRYGKVVVE